MFTNANKVVVFAGAVGAILLAAQDANAQCYSTTRVYRDYYPSYYTPVRVAPRVVYVDRPYYYDSGRRYRYHRPYRSSGFSFGFSYSNAKHYRGDRYYDGYRRSRHGRSYDRGHSRHHSRHHGRRYRNHRRY